MVTTLKNWQLCQGWRSLFASRPMEAIFDSLSRTLGATPNRFGRSALMEPIYTLYFPAGISPRGSAVGRGPLMDVIIFLLSATKGITTMCGHVESQRRFLKSQLRQLV